MFLKKIVMFPFSDVSFDRETLSSLANNSQLLLPSLHHYSKLPLGNGTFLIYLFIFLIFPKALFFPINLPLILSTTQTYPSTLKADFRLDMYVSAELQPQMYKVEFSMETIVFFMGQILSPFLLQSCKRIKRNCLSLQVNLWM